VTQSDLKRYWQSLGRSSSLSLRVPLWYAPVGAIGPLLLDHPEGRGSFATWIGIVASSELALLACFALARGMIHGLVKVSRDGLGSSVPARQGMRPIATLVAFGVAAIMRGLVVAYLAKGILRTSFLEEIAYRAGAALLLQVGLMVLIALLLNDRDDHRQIVHDLRRHERQLIELEVRAAERLAQLQQQLVSEVRWAIEPQLQSLLLKLADRRAGGGVQERTRLILAFIDDEIRPLSHRLVSTPIDDIDLPLPERMPTRIPSRLPRLLAVTDCLLTWPSVWVMFAASIFGGLRNAVPGQQYSLMLSMTGATWLGLFLARQGAISWWLPTPVVIAYVVLLNTMLPTVALWVLFRLDVTGSNVVVAGAVLGACVGLLSAMYGAVRQARRQATDDLQLAIARLEISVNILRQKAWVTRRQMGYVLHGALQGALVAAGIRMATSDPGDPLVLRAISDDLHQALARLESPSALSNDFSGVLADIATLWSDDCELSIVVNEIAREALASRVDTARCAAEVVREAVGNAIRHGRANRVWVTVSVTEQLVHLEVVDDGVGFDGCPRPGLGARMCDEMCLDWSLTRESDRTVLAARLALAQDPDRRDAYPASGAGITQAPEQRAHALGARTHGTQVMDAS